MASGATRAIDTAPWHHAVTKILAFSEEKGVRIVGVIGDRPGVGVSLLCRQLALSYSRSGANALIVDASRVDKTVAPSVEAANKPLDLLGMATAIETGLAQIDLAEHSDSLPASRDELRVIFDQAAASGVSIIVDLPAIHDGTEYDTRIAGLVGGACQLVYLVSLSGLIKRADLRSCVERCKFNHIPIGGIIVNDWKEPAAWLATEW